MTIQATNLAGQPLTGLTWTTSDAASVALSTDNPPMLTAVAAGHATIKAGTASVDVMVAPGELPMGTVVWSNPGDGSGVSSIVPAVPSPSGVADVFAFQNDSTVQAIRGDGTTAWTADLSKALVPEQDAIPDFMGGLVAAEIVGGDHYDTIVRFDGITGQPSTVYNAGPGSGSLYVATVHPDGTIFAMTRTDNGHINAVVGIDPTSGAKFSVPIPVQNIVGGQYGGGIIAGDGYFYFAYTTQENLSGSGTVYRIKLLQVDTNGGSATSEVTSWVTIAPYDWSPVEIAMITNADQGVLMSWGHDGVLGMAVTTGTSVSIVNAPSLPNGGLVVPVLQAQDGSFVGTIAVGPCCGPTQDNLVSFDASGSVGWSVAGNWQPEIATADGGSIATDDSGVAFTFDADGGATGQIGSFPIYSWKGAYEIGSTNSRIPVLDVAGVLAQTHIAARGGNLTHNGFSLVLHTFGLVFCGAEGDGPCPVNDSRFYGNPFQFSYLPLDRLSDQTYNALPPTGPADFSAAHPEWVQTIRTKATEAYTAAFALMPAIVRQKWSANAVSPPKFEHTVYVTGKWYTGRDFYQIGQVTGYTNPVGNCASSGCATYGTSSLFYLSIMGYSQKALQFLIPGRTDPLSPAYPPSPSDRTATTQFLQVMTAIGTGIGNIAAHKTGHQLHVPEMECSIGNNDACPEARIYQNGNSDGKANEWFYGVVPDGKIHWTADADCKIYQLLGMMNTGCR